MTRRNRKLCIAVAKDVLIQLRLKRFEATPGTYVNIDINYNDNENYYNVMDQSFKTFFKKRVKTTCQVCAIGATFG